MAAQVVLLDIDGTLIDSNDAHAHAWTDVGLEFGIDIPYEKVRPLIGMGSDKVVPILAGVERESSRGKELADRHGVVFREKYLPTLRAFDGARALLERLKAEGRTLVVATSASSRDMRAILEHVDLADLIDERTSSSDADESKPSPDIVEAALGEADAEPAQAVMLGDTPYDVEAAGRAGVPCIAFRCGGWWDDDALGHAAAIYDGPAHLLASLDDSPLGRRGG